MSKIYSGIGSRLTPIDVLGMMTNIASKLDNLGYILRSGAAKGADSAFELGSTNKEIFKAENCTSEAMKLSRQFHPAWHKLDAYAKRLHGRNSLIILGKYLNDPVDFIILWTPNGLEVGGSGQAMRIATHFKIPMFNLANEEHKQRLLKFINS
jgi:hypothetical protein